MAKYIDADASRDGFMTAVYDILADDNTNGRANEIIDIFDTLPAADVEPVRHGKWRFCGNDGFENAYVCSECGKIANDDSKFCPRCGAKMDGGSE